MNNQEPKRYRLESKEKLGLYTEGLDGSHAMGRRALRNIVRLARGKEFLPPEQPENRSGITFTHADGSYDTGTRAVANAVRAHRSEDPKIYKRTMRPLEDAPDRQDH